MNEAAFRDFYAKTASPLGSYIGRMAADRALAEDLFQETYFRFLRKPPASAGESEMTAYLYRIATNLLYDHWRRKARERRSLEEAEPPPPSGPDEGLRHDMARTFQMLKPQERALLWLAYVEGCAHREIAAKLGLKEKSVRVLLFRARKRMAGLLEKQGTVSEVRT